MNDLREKFATLIYLATGKRVITPLMRKALERKWRKECINMQNELNAEHSARLGWYCVGGKICRCMTTK